jgi:AraC-like DNA-binding protein
MFYREAAPSKDTAPVVLSFWEFTVGGQIGDCVNHGVYPDGCFTLLYKKNLHSQIHKLILVGLSAQSAHYQISSGDVYRGMRLSPAAARAFLKADPITVPSQPAGNLPALAEFADDLIDKLAASVSFDETIIVFEDFVRRANIELREIDDRVAAAVQFIEENQAQVKITDVADAVGLSVRQLERRFRLASGLTPKQYVRARRIRQTAINLVENAESNWANRAAALGFTDQAHLTHEFNYMTSLSPVKFGEIIQRIGHGKIVK